MTRKKKKSPNAFTLIELLVVISIIALLLAILMPALNSVKEAARSVVCLANVRRIGMAGYIYALEEEDSFPPFRMAKSTPTSGDFVNDYGRVKPRWPWFFDHGIGPVIDPRPFVQNPGDTFGDSDTLIMTNDFFMCPGFKHRDFDKRDIRNGSYGYNYQYLGNSRVGDGGFVRFPVKANRIRRTAETVMIADSRGACGDDRPMDIEHGHHAYTLDPPKVARSTGSVSFAWHSRTGGLQNQHSPAEARHKGKASVTFVDGHTESMTLEELGYVQNEHGTVIADQGDNKLWSGNGRDEP